MARVGITFETIPASAKIKSFVMGEAGESEELSYKQFNTKFSYNINDGAQFSTPGAVTYTYATAKAIEGGSESLYLPVDLGDFTANDILIGEVTIDVDGKSYTKSIEQKVSETKSYPAGSIATLLFPASFTEEFSLPAAGTQIYTTNTADFVLSSNPKTTAGKQGYYTYSLQPANANFAIDAATGVITVAADHALTREK